MMIKEETSESEISDYEEDDLNMVENESSSSYESEECECLGNCVCEYKINAITNDSEEVKLLIELMEKIEDKEVKRMYLDKLKEKIKENNTIEETQDYNLIEVFKKFNDKPKPITIPELQEEIKTVKAEIAVIKQRMIREFSARWWNAVSEDQADMKAVMSHYNSLVRSPSPGPSCSNTDDDTIKRIQECKSKEEIQRILDEVRKSPTPSEELYQDSQDPYEDDGFLS
ncbi:reverse transcriptase domain, Zinc finger, CCHC-type, Aspartic peptidase domain protein [Artemisia annua]|uniref:Reverse transcriptase domain, Zinc finger, CCHC-type, Aspartic peptidase domain protein n=1 Tax=Artemisia annua TaxID=35608 RepID=A0A2U1KT87_ARTAN|nr:reverse transcriptase domain, Zinc finger, CCHC-type, Aspartic peptidase domain protein [Artemisia annua]